MPKTCQKEENIRQSYYLRHRKNGFISVVFIDSVTEKRIEKSTGTNDEKKANAIAQEWLANGLPDKPSVSNIAKKTTFCDYLYQFWEFEKSEYDYFRELQTMGKNPNPEHALEMQKAVNRYYRPYFESKLLCQINEEVLQKFIVH